MEAVKILLWDCDVGSGLADSLKTILESSSAFSLDLKHERVETEDLNTDLLQQAVSPFNPRLILLTLPAGSLRRFHTALQRLSRDHVPQPIMIAAQSADPVEIFESLRSGVSDFLVAPLNTASVLPRVWRVLEKEWSGARAAQASRKKLETLQIIGESPAFLAEVEKLSKVASCDVSVLISGETGTGKEVFARTIHNLSHRAHKPFMAINCGAIPTELAENELFGHMRGAYTGASSEHSGMITQARGGTLFLDEIDSLPLAAQVKLLRLLQEKEYRPLGSTKTLKSDVRIISASSLDLKEAVMIGKLRQDLYYRLNIVAITLPPLRERHEDIIPLARHFLVKYAASANQPIKRFSPQALLKLASHDWPGNVRELENIVERAVVLSGDEVIEDYHLTFCGSEKAAAQEPFQKAKAKVVNQFERNYIRSVLLAHDGNITRAADAAQKDRRAFVQLIRKHHIVVHELKPEIFLKDHLARL